MGVVLVDREQMDMLKELMEVSFVLIETALYLNTHPNDERALRLHNKNSVIYDQLESMYRVKYGPLRNNDISGYPWAYINAPWPWEVNFSSNQGGL